jgi:hypothetical protein
MCAITVLLAACHSQRQFAIKNGNLSPGEPLVLTAPNKGDVAVASSFEVAHIEFTDTGPSHDRVQLDWPKDPGLFLVHMNTKDATTSLLLRVDADGDRRNVATAAQASVTGLSVVDHELWKRFCEGLPDEDLHKAVSLRISQWIGGDPDDAHPFVIALGTVTFRPMVLVGGPGAAHQDQQIWLSLVDEIVATANQFEYAASGIDFGIVSNAEATRLRQLMRRVLVVDIETAARGLPCDSQGILFESSGLAGVTALANRTWAFAMGDDSASRIAEYCRGGSSLVVLIRALPPSRTSMTGGLQLGSIPLTRQRATMSSQASGPTRDQRLIQISQRTPVGK